MIKSHFALGSLVAVKVALINTFSIFIIPLNLLSNRLRRELLTKSQSL